MNTDASYIYVVCGWEYCPRKGLPFRTHNHRQKYCCHQCNSAYLNTLRPKKEPRNTEFERAAWEIVEDKEKDEESRFIAGERLTSDLDMKWLLYEGNLAAGSIVKNLTTGDSFKVDYTKKGAFAYVIAKCLIKIE